MTEHEILAGLKSCREAIQTGNEKVAARLAVLENANLDTRLSELERAKALRDAEGGAAGDMSRAPGALYRAVMENAEAIQAFGKGTAGKVAFEVKNTILTSPSAPTLFAPADRVPGIIPGQGRPLDLLDVLGALPASGNVVEGTREALFTNAAAETSEGEDKPESTITFEAVQFPVRTIPHLIKVSRQALDDGTSLASYLDARMSFGVRSRLEAQVVNGNGTSPNLAGLLASGNHTAATAVTGEGLAQFVRRQKNELRKLGVPERDMLVVANPNDWSEYELSLSASSGDAGSLAALIAAGIPPSLWRLPVVESSSVPEGTAIVMARSAAQPYERSGVVVQFFEQDEDNVQKNLVTVRAEGRFAFAVYQPWAIRAGEFSA